MKKILLFLIIFFPINIFALTLPEISSKNVLIYDITDKKILESVNPDQQLYIASITKILTAITAIEKINDFNQEVTITDVMLSNIPSDASMAGLNVGDVVTLDDLLYAILLPSGADACHSIAITLNGSVESFVADMNTLAKKIGMNNSNFVNPTGLDHIDHVSTPNDILKLLLYALDNPKFKEVYTSKSRTLKSGLDVHSFVNSMGKTEELDLTEVVGSKTGYDTLAGQCMSALVKSNGHDIIILTFNAEYYWKGYNHIKDLSTLINYLDTFYDYQVLLNQDEVVDTIKVTLSKIDKLDIKNPKDIKKYLPSDFDKSLIRYEYIGIKQINYTNKYGSLLGKINVYYDNELVGSNEVYLLENIKPDILKIIKKHRKEIYVGIAWIFLFIILILLLKRLAHKNKA